MEGDARGSEGMIPKGVILEGTIPEVAEGRPLKGSFEGKGAFPWRAVGEQSLKGTFGARGDVTLRNQCRGGERQF